MGSNSENAEGNDYGHTPDSSRTNSEDSSEEGPQDKGKRMDVEAVDVEYRMKQLLGRMEKNDDDSDSQEERRGKYKSTAHDFWHGQDDDDN